MKYPTFTPILITLKMASVAILVCGDLELEQHKDFWVQDCSAAIENILVAVHAKGLGAVWLGLYPRTERVAGMRELLGIPDQVVPLAIIPIGYPAEEKPPAMRFNASRIHYNKW